MKNNHADPLITLWQDAGLKGYSLRLEGQYIRLVPIHSQGMEQGKSFATDNEGFQQAQAWLKTISSPYEEEATHGGVKG
jgi:hypothetical protein